MKGLTPSCLRGSTGEDKDPRRLEGWWEREIYLTLHCHHPNGSCVKMGSAESHFTGIVSARDAICVCVRARARAIMLMRVFYRALCENVNLCMFCLLVYIPLICFSVFAIRMFFFKL